MLPVISNRGRILMTCGRAGLILLAFMLTAAAWQPSQTAASAEEMFYKLRRLYPTITPLERANQTVRGIAGHYTHNATGLFGRELYLFSDQTYLYTEWADILPETIYEKGGWKVTDGFVTLMPDKSLPRSSSRRDHIYLPVCIVGSDAVYVISNRWDFSYFLDHAENRLGPASMFEGVAMRRAEILPAGQEKSLKERLLREAWRPEFFESKGQRVWHKTLRILVWVVLPLLAGVAAVVLPIMFYRKQRRGVFLALGIINGVLCGVGLLVLAATSGILVWFALPVLGGVAAIVLPIVFYRKRRRGVLLALSIINGVLCGMGILVLVATLIFHLYHTSIPYIWIGLGLLAFAVIAAATARSRPWEPVDNRH